MRVYWAALIIDALKKNGTCVCYQLYKLLFIVF